MKESNQQRARLLLKPYRKQIDALDDQILKLLGKRFDIVKKVAKIKVKHDLPSFLHDRVVEVRERCTKIGKKYGIEPSFVRALYSAIIYQSCETEDGIKGKLKKK
jgi:chorismate mutase-like protein